jgi:hypothetical protein
MSKQLKIRLIIAASLVLLGVIIFGGVMTVLKWDFRKLSTVKYETNTYEPGDNFKNISVVTNTADIVFLPSENSKTSVVCYEQQKLKHSVTVNDSSLVIEVVDSRKWYDYIGISFGTPKITVYIPQGEYGNLLINTSTGDVEIPKDFKFKSIDVSESTGDVKNYASASELVKLKTGTGDIYVENISAGAIELSVTTGKVTASGVTCDGDINIKVTTGKTGVSSVKCKNLVSSGNTGRISLKDVFAAEKISIERSTGDVSLENSVAGKLSLETDTGDVTLNSCDATEIFVETDTGDVTGTLLSEKVFIAKTDTGKVRVPSSVTGGRCEITTDTGDIKIEIAE